MDRFLINNLTVAMANHNNFVLATILHRVGSTPRSSGSRMAVFENGKSVGTIGGGKAEKIVVDKATEILSTHAWCNLEINFTGKDAASMEMICGGTFKVLIEWIDGSDPEKEAFFNKLNDAIASHTPAWWAQEIIPGQEINHSLRDGSTLLAGKSARLIDFVEKNQVSFLIEQDAYQAFAEFLGTNGTAYIFGAGHVAQPLAHLCKLVDFEVFVIDDREEYANSGRFPDANRILVPSEIEKTFSEEEIEPNSCIIIVTRGHMQDQVVLEWALTTPARYIGMIGSRRKWQLIHEDLLAKGFKEKDLARVHSPIGLSILAETPGEIAVSVVAEIIKERAGWTF